MVAVVKRLKVLATCREIWKAVSLVTNQPEELMTTSLLWIYKRFLRWTFKPFKLQSQELGRDN
jgi:hypothetical protein